MKKILIASMASMAFFAAEAKNFAGVEFGLATADINGSDVRETAEYLSYLSGQRVRYSVDDSTTNIRFYGGTEMDSKTKLEMGYFNTGNVGANFEGVYYGSASTKASASGLDISVLHDPYSNGFFLKAGLHSSKVKSSITISDGRYSETASESVSGIGFLYGLGYSKDLDADLAVRGSFVVYQKLGGESQADMNMMSVGISKKF